MAELTYSDVIVALANGPVPEHSRDCTRLRWMDSLGIGIAAVAVPPALATLETARLAFGIGDTPVLGFAQRLSPGAAAQVNATLIHALDYDDTYLAGAMHISAMTVAAAMAAGSVSGATIGRTLDGIAVGTEAACWLGTFAPRDLHRQGFQPTAVFGAIGAVVSASYVLGLDDARMKSAIGIATSVAAGLCQFEESWVKNWNIGWAAQTGMTSAISASTGFVGPQLPIEGEKGFFAAHLGLHLPTVPERLPGGVGAGGVWESDAIALKKYACCHFIHAAIDAALDIAARVDAAQIDNVVVYAPQLAIGYTAEPLDFRRRPSNVYRARFAGPWIIARALIERNVTLATFDDVVDVAPAILDLADRTVFQAEEFPTFPRDWPGRVKVTMKDGTVHEVAAAGAPVKVAPENRVLVEAKFRQNMEYVSVDPALWERLMQILDAPGLALSDLDAALPAAGAGR